VGIMKIFRVLDKIRNRYDLWKIYYEYRIGKLIEKLEIQKKDIVIDFGCGNMRFKKYIKGKYIGIDIKEPNVKKGYFIKCNLDEEFPDIKFNKGVLILVVELLKMYDFFFRMLSKHIMEGGRLLITIPNFQSEHYKYWKNQDLKKKNPTSLLQNNITMNRLKTELLRNNFRVIEEEGIFAYPFSKGYRYPFFLRFIPIIKVVEMKGRIPVNEMSYYYLIAGKDKEHPIMNYDYRTYLNQALNILFRSTKNNGFWDEEENKIIRALNYEFTKENKIVWSPDNSVKWRYAPFALMGVMQWRASGIFNGTYDSKIKAELAYFIEKVKDKQILSKMPSYGIGPLILSFSLAYAVFHDEKYKDVAWELYEYSAKRFNFSNSEDSLLLYGWCYLYEIGKNKSLQNSIINVLETIIKKQNEQGLFIFENPTTKRHQNQMYTLWGVGKAIEVSNKKEYLPNIEKTLNYTIKYRMLKNGAFIWEDLPFKEKLKSKFIYKIKNVIPDWELLFECHQTFFVNAVFQYYKAAGEKYYDPYVKRAMDWIYGNNSLNKNLVEISGIGVPMRMMSIKGKMDVNGQMFKGSYEIGSYVMALTNLIQSGRF